MSDKIQCDNCGALDRPGAEGWQRTTFLDFAFVLSDDVEHTFCSWGCIAAYAQHRHDVAQGGIAAQDQTMHRLRVGYHWRYQPPPPPPTAPHPVYVPDALRSDQ